MDAISDFDDITIPKTYDILESINNTYDIDREPLKPTYAYYDGCGISYEKFNAWINKIM